MTETNQELLSKILDEELSEFEAQRIFERNKNR